MHYVSPTEDTSAINEANCLPKQFDISGIDERSKKSVGFNIARLDYRESSE